LSSLGCGPSLDWFGCSGSRYLGPLHLFRKVATVTFDPLLSSHWKEPDEVLLARSPKRGSPCSSRTQAAPPLPLRWAAPSVPTSRSLDFADPQKVTHSVDLLGDFLPHLTATHSFLVSKNECPNPLGVPRQQPVVNWLSSPHRSNPASSPALVTSMILFAWQPQHPQTSTGSFSPRRALSHPRKGSRFMSFGLTPSNVV
jgi:hypothetical protein